MKGLTDVNIHQYVGGEDGGLAHITYWGLPRANPNYYGALSSQEQAKVGKINANLLHAAAFQPTNADIAGTEVTGLLKMGKRVQSITFRRPDEWNEKLVVAGTPGLRNEYANEAVLVPWLLEAGYAYIAGDKGTLAMGWFYSETLSTPEEYAKNPRFPGAYFSMVNAGFSPESALYWGYYNTNYDGYQYVPGFEIFRGVGYYNRISPICRRPCSHTPCEPSGTWWIGWKTAMNRRTANLSRPILPTMSLILSYLTGRKSKDPLVSVFAFYREPETRVHALC